MKNPLTNLHEALVYQLEGLYDAEKRLQKAMPILKHKVMLPALQTAIIRYGEQASDKRTKLKRAFSYLGCGPFGRKNRIMHDFLKNTLELCEHTSADRIRDAMAIACLKNISQYKLADYGTALGFAIALELDTVSDLLHEMISWEKETADALEDLRIAQLSAKPGPIVASHAQK
ncbi:MAG TPA: DUF892 family protein [Chryseolinea sp.]